MQKKRLLVPRNIHLAFSWRHIIKNGPHFYSIFVIQSDLFEYLGVHYLEVFTEI